MRVAVGMEGELLWGWYPVGLLARLTVLLSCVRARGRDGSTGVTSASDL